VNTANAAADGVLGDVKDLAFFEVQMLQEAIQFAGGDAPRSRLVDLADQPEQRGHAGAGQGREEDDRRVIQKLELVRTAVSNSRFFWPACPFI